MACAEKIFNGISKFGPVQAPARVPQVSFGGGGKQVHRCQAILEIFIRKNEKTCSNFLYFSHCVEYVLIFLENFLKTNRNILYGIDSTYQVFFAWLRQKGHF